MCAMVNGEGPGPDGFEQLLRGDVGEYTIDLRQGSSGPFDRFGWRFQCGFRDYDGLRKAGASVVSPYLSADGSLPEEGDMVKVPVFVREHRPGHHQVTVYVKLRKVSTFWLGVADLLDSSPSVWAQLGQVMGQSLACEAEEVYHFNKNGGLLTSGVRDTNLEVTVPSDMSRSDLLSKLVGLPADSAVPARSGGLGLSDRTAYLLNPKFWSQVLEPGARFPLRSYQVVSDRFLWAGQEGDPTPRPGAVLAAFGDWYEAFVIVGSDKVCFKVEGDKLVAETVTGGAVTGFLGGKAAHVLLTAGSGS